MPSLEGELVTPLRDTLVRGFSGWSVELEAGSITGRGRLHVTLPGLSTPISCGVDLVPPPPLPEPISRSTFVALDAPVVGAPLMLRFWPLDVSGRSLGSGVPLSSSATNVSMMSDFAYRGFGRYELGLVPRSPGPLEVVVRSESGQELARLDLIVVGDGDSEPGPEPSPEEVEEVEASEPEPEVVEEVDVSPVDPTDTSEGQDDVKEDAFETAPEVAEEPEETSAPEEDSVVEKKPRRESGCVSGGPMALPLLLLLLRYRRPLDASR
jgi:hypothetical protein